MPELSLGETLRNLTLECIRCLRRRGASPETIEAEVLSAAERALDESGPARNPVPADCSSLFRTLFDQPGAGFHAPDARVRVLEEVRRLAAELRDLP